MLAHREYNPSINMLLKMLWKFIIGDDPNEIAVIRRGTFAYSINSLPV